MSDHFVIVTGFLDTEEKEKYAVDIFNKLSKIDKITTCYVTHHKNIPDKILDNANYVIYNSYNPIMNWDIYDDHSKKFRSVLKINDLLEIHYPQPYHGFAHLISMCDGIALGVNKGYQTFSFMNYDVVDFCIEQLPHHIKEIKKKNTDTIFYPYYIENIKRMVGSTEFFTFNTKFAKAIYNYSKYSVFKKIEDPGLENLVNTVCKIHGVKTLFVENSYSKNGTLGKVNFGVDNVIFNYFYPYIKIKNKNITHDILMIPFKQNKEHYICFKQDEHIENLNVYVNSLEIVEKTINKISIPCEIKILHHKKEVFNFNLHDDRHFGWTK